MTTELVFEFLPEVVAPIDLLFGESSEPVVYNTKQFLLIDTMVTT